MVEIFDEVGKAFLRQALEAHPEWEQGLEPGVFSDDPFEIVYPKLRIPSAHPTIETPLTVELGGTLQLFWHGGYFFDFVGDDQASDAFEFLERFFREEVRCGTRWEGESVVGGGPVEGDGVPPWNKDGDRIEVRSWRGNRDEIAYK